MFKYKLFGTLSLSFIFIGCASTHPGQMAKCTSGDLGAQLIVSAKNMENPNQKSYQLVEVTIENKSDSWVRIQSGQIVVDDPATSKVSTVMGKDLSDWAQAKKFEVEKNEYNNLLTQGVILGTGAVLSVAGKDSDLGKLGSLMVVGTLGWAVFDTVNSEIEKTNTASKVPQSHLGNSAAIPGGLFVRRWVLLNKPAKEKIKTLNIELTTIEGKKALYAVKM